MRYCIIGLLIVFVVVGVVLFLFPQGESRQASRNFQCRVNLKRLGLALRQYHDDWGSFPPAYVVDDTGRPSYGWRTLILPYLDRPPVYDAYHFDEPWDGPRNGELRNRFASCGTPFGCPDEWNYLDQTSYVAVVGPDTAWPGPVGAKRHVDFPDGLSSTILLIEVQDTGIHWLEPRDLQFDSMTFQVNDPAGKSPSSRHVIGAKWPWSRTIASVNVLFADGTVAQLPRDTPPATIRAWLTANGGEQISQPP